MIREQVLFQSSTVVVAIYDHPGPGPHRDPAEEVARSHAVSLVEQGAFELRRRRERLWMRAGAVMVTHPGYAYSCQHREEFPTDRCLAVIPSPGLVESIASDGSGRLEAVPAHRRAAARTAYQFLGLRELLLRPGGPAEPLEVEVRAMELLAGVARWNRRARVGFRLGQVAWYAPRIDAARERIQADFRETHTLASLARGAGMSPFHFARVFAELTGTPPHRYLVEVRLMAARAMLLEGAGVTPAALACGFGNLSHFVRSYRRRFGTVPSATRSSQESASVRPAGAATLTHARRDADATARRRRHEATGDSPCSTT